jgi:hypothetical protein
MRQRPPHLHPRVGNAHALPRPRPVATIQEVTEGVRAAKCVVTASSLRAGIRALLTVLPTDLLSRPEVVDVRARLAPHVEIRVRGPRDIAALEAEVRDLADLGGRLTTACWPQPESNGPFGVALSRLRTNVSLARCLVHRRVSIPPPASKMG